MGRTVSEKSYAENHLGQDPAEGSREVIDHDLGQSDDEDVGEDAKQGESNPPAFSDRASQRESTLRP